MAQCVKIAAVGYEMAKLNVSSPKMNKSTVISVDFYELDAQDQCLKSADSTNCQVDEPSVVIYACADVASYESGLVQCVVACGPSSLRDGRRMISMYSFNCGPYHDIMPLGQFQLPPEVIDDFRCELIDGPSVCFVSGGNLYIGTADGTVRLYPLAVDSFRILAVLTEYELLILVAKLEAKSEMFSVCINTETKKFAHCKNNLVPHVYTDIITCMLLSTVDLDWESLSSSKVNSNIESEMPSLSVTKSIMWHLENVQSVLVGDFLKRGLNQVLFLPHENTEDVDILSMIDSMETNDSGNIDRFLLTDFSEVKIDRWNAAPPNTESESNRTKVLASALAALKRRAQAGQSELDALKIRNDMKKLIADDAMACLSGCQSPGPSPVPLVNIARGENCNIPDPAYEVDISDPTRTPTSRDLVEFGPLWQWFHDNHWIIGVRIYNSSSSTIRRLGLVPMPISCESQDKAASKNKVDSHSRFFRYRMQPLPDPENLTFTEYVLKNSCDSSTTTSKLEKVDVKCSGVQMPSLNEDFGKLFHCHHIENTPELPPKCDGHMVVMADLSCFPTAVMVDVTCMMTAMWRSDDVDTDETISHRVCGFVTLSPKSMLKPECRVMFSALRPQPELSDEQTVEILLCINALTPFRRLVMLKSVDQSAASTNMSTLLTPLYAALTRELQFTMYCGCCICVDRSSGLFMSSVEAVTPGGYNFCVLTLAGKSDEQLLLLMRALYDMLPDTHVFVPIVCEHAVDDVTTMINESCKP